MDNKEVSKEILNSKFNQDNNLNDYKSLLLKLKSIKKSISLLEEMFSIKNP